MSKFKSAKTGKYVKPGLAKKHPNTAYKTKNRWDGLAARARARGSPLLATIGPCAG